MKYYVGLDISNKDTSICIVDDDANIVKEAKVLTDPDSIHTYLTKTGFKIERVGLETGSLSNWLYTKLKASGWTMICMDSRFMSAILSVNVNKTDRNDARAIANAIRCKNYKVVHIKSNESLTTNCLLTSRKTLLKQKIQLENVIRGSLKTFGIKLPKGKKHVRDAIQEALAFEAFTVEKDKLAYNVDWNVIECLIVCCEKIEQQLEVLKNKLEHLAKSDPVIQRLMTHPGVGIVTAVTYKAEIDDPTRFKKSRSVGSYLGMTPKQSSSGETIIQGRVSKQGSSELRGLLHECGIVLLTRSKSKSKLKSWGLKKKRKLKTAKASMAVGRKIAVNLHRMWIDGKNFDPQMSGDAVCPEEELEEIEKEKRKEKKLVMAQKKKNKT